MDVEEIKQSINQARLKLWEEIKSIPYYAQRALWKFGLYEPEEQVVPSTTRDTFGLLRQKDSSVLFPESGVQFRLKEERDNRGDLSVHRNYYSSDTGYNYMPLPTKGNTGAPKQVEGGAVAHFFILDGRPSDFKDIYDADQNELLRQSKWFKNDSGLWAKAKDEDIFPVFSKDDEGRVNVKYKKKSKISDDEAVVQNLVRYKAGDIDFDSEMDIPSSSQYSRLWDSKNRKLLATKDGKPINSIIFSSSKHGKDGKDVYSKFSGASGVLIAEDSKGELYVKDFSGSVNNLKEGITEFAKLTGVNSGDITVAFYDAGSLTAKPIGEDGKLSRSAWYGFNTKGYSGSGLAFPANFDFINLNTPEVETDYTGRDRDLISNLSRDTTLPGFSTELNSRHIFSPSNMAASEANIKQVEETIINKYKSEVGLPSTIPQLSFSLPHNTEDMKVLEEVGISAFNTPKDLPRLDLDLDSIAQQSQQQKLNFNQLKSKIFNEVLPNVRKEIQPTPQGDFNRDLLPGFRETIPSIDTPPATPQGDFNRDLLLTFEERLGLNKSREQFKSLLKDSFTDRLLSQSSANTLKETTPNKPYSPNLNTDLSAWLNTQGVDSSYTNRKKIYEKTTGLSDYKGTASQNIALLNKLKDEGLQSLDVRKEVSKSPYLPPIDKLSDFIKNNRLKELDKGTLTEQVPSTSQDRKVVHPTFQALSDVITNRNRNIEWVDRALNPKEGLFIENEDGRRSTHELSFVTGDRGEAYVFPTIVNKNGKLVRMEQDEALKYAEKTNTLVEIPNVKLAEYYSQHGLIPHFQDGGRFTPPSDNTRFVNQNIPLHLREKQISLPKNLPSADIVGLYHKAQEARRLQEIRERRERISTANEEQKKPLLRQNLKVASALSDKLRVSENPNFFDDYINPAVYLGHLADKTGSFGQNIMEGNLLQGTADLGEVLGVGLLGGYGTKSTKQFANNLFNPIAGVDEAISKKVSQDGPKKILSNNIEKQGFDWNFITRPLTPFTKNELTSIPGQNMGYRKIGNRKGLEDLIDKQGAQAPSPIRMKSGLHVDTPFFGVGTKPNENYSGLFAVEVDLQNPKYKWTSRVGGVDNYGVAPLETATGNLLQNVPLEDLNVYRKKWFSNNYKKIDNTNLEEALKYADTQYYLEKLWKWGARGGLIYGALRDKKENRESSQGSNSTQRFQEGGLLTNTKFTF